MLRWEYKTVFLDPLANAPKNLEKNLNSWGEQGWELCFVLPRPGYFLFKRPLPRRGDPPVVVTMDAEVPAVPVLKRARKTDVAR